MRLIEGAATMHPNGHIDLIPWAVRVGDESSAGRWSRFSASLFRAQYPPPYQIVYRIPEFAKFDWQDPFFLNSQLTEDEQLVSQSAREYCQSRLFPRVLEAFRHESALSAG